MSVVKKDGIVVAKSSKKSRKYKATFPDGKVVHFGAASYPQFKDGTRLGLFSHKNHGDPARRENFRKRHDCSQKPKKTAGYLSCKYLW